MFQPNKKIIVIVPCFNESAGITSVLKSFPRRELSKLKWTVEVMVVDNNSTDNTGELAEKHGASVVTERQQGKGNALLTGLRQIPEDADYVVMLDGDNTYHPKEIFRMIEPLDTGFCDVILGSRIQGKMKSGSMNFTSRLGNWLFSFLVRQFYKVNVTDVLTGYFAWKKSSLDILLPHIKCTGFEVEMEMITKMAKLGLEIYSVPISYHPRLGRSKLNHFKDGAIIMGTFLNNLNWTPDKDDDTTRPEPYRNFSPKAA